MNSFWKRYFTEYKKTLLLSAPVIIAQLGQILVGLIDNIMIGHLGRTELAAASFTNTLFYLIIFFGMGFSYALTPVVGQLWGKRETGELGSWLKNGIMSNIIMGFLLSIVLCLVAELMPYMGQPKSVVFPSQSYLYILTISVLPMMIFYGYKQFAEGLGDTKTAMVIVLIANGINILGNYMFMFGKLGMPELGLIGAGVGTVISRIFMAVAFFAIFRYKSLFKEYTGILSSSMFSIEKIKRLSLLGMPIGGQMVMESAAFGFCAIMMGWISELGMASHQIAINLSTLGFMIFQGLGAGTTIRVSHAKGNNDLKGIGMATTSGIHLMLFYSVISMALFIGARNLLPQIFTNDNEVVMLTAQMLIICAFFQLFDGFQVVLAGSLRGLADVQVPAVITFISYFMISIPFSYFAAFKWGFGAVGIWYGFPVGLATSSFLYYMRYLYITRRKPDTLVAMA